MILPLILGFTVKPGQASTRGGGGGGTAIYGLYRDVPL